MQAELECHTHPTYLGHRLQDRNQKDATLWQASASPHEGILHLLHYCRSQHWLENSGIIWIVWQSKRRLVPRNHVARTWFNEISWIVVCCQKPTRLQVDKAGLFSSSVDAWCKLANDLVSTPLLSLSQPTNVTKNISFSATATFFHTWTKSVSRDHPGALAIKIIQNAGSKHGKVETPPWEVKNQAVKLMSMIRNNAMCIDRPSKPGILKFWRLRLILRLASETYHFGARPRDKAWVLNFEFSLLRCHPATLQLSPQTQAEKVPHLPKQPQCLAFWTKTSTLVTLTLFEMIDWRYLRNPSVTGRCMQEIFCRTCAVYEKLNINMTICQLLLSTSALAKGPTHFRQPRLAASILEVRWI